MNNYSKIVFICVVICMWNQLTYSNTNYCGMNQVPACRNKPHVLCSPRTVSKISINQDAISSILDEFNTYRQKLKRFRFICNLDDFKWNKDYEMIASEVMFKSWVDYCNITAQYKNSLETHRYTFPVTNYINENIIKYILYLIKVPETAFWLASAYSTEIGCNLVERDGNIILICITNGITLSYYNQSWGYNDECSVEKNRFVNEACGKVDSSCTNHIICNQHTNFINASLLTINFSTQRFILLKFQMDQQNVTWSYDLQYFAEQIVVQNMSDNAKCLALKRFRHLSDLHYTGIQFYEDPISNIDSIWQMYNVSGQIGCAIFNSTIDGTGYFYMYCLTGVKYIPMAAVRLVDYIGNYFKFIKFDRRDFWIINLLLVLTVLDIVMIFVLLHYLFKFERRRTIFCINDP